MWGKENEIIGSRGFSALSLLRWMIYLVTKRGKNNSRVFIKQFRFVSYGAYFVLLLVFLQYFKYINISEYFLGTVYCLFC
jgi:hypothetical protein